jgi:hypothetical protein
MSDVLNIISHSEVISDNVILRLQNRIWQKDLCQNMLGDALYLLSGNFDLIDWNTQKIIRDEFSWIHQKLIDSLEKIVKNQITLYDKLPCPAFHIFGSSEFNKLEFSYHKDISVCDYDKNIDKNSIYSYVTVIQSPSEQPFLDYVFGKQVYEKTKLYIWKGTMDHRIGTFSLSGGEYRITLQGHMFYDKQDKIVKLFF